MLHLIDQINELSLAKLKLLDFSQRNSPDSLAYLKETRCKMCSWLQSRIQYQDEDADIIRLKILHEKMHTLTDEIIAEIQKGANIDALRSLGSGSEYAAISREFVRVMMALDRKEQQKIAKALNVRKKHH